MSTVLFEELLITTLKDMCVSSMHSLYILYLAI